MRKKLVDVLKWLWIASVLIGAGWYFFRHFQSISGYLESVSFPRLLLAFAVLMAGKFLLSDITRLSLKKIGWKISYREALAITSVTQLGKYLPGGIWHIAGKFGLYKVKGISTKQTTQAMIYENIWLLSSAFLIGILTLMVFSGELVCGYITFMCDHQVITVFSIALPLLWLIALILFERIFFKDQKTTISDFILVLAEQVLIWIFFGISFWLVFPPTGGFAPQIIGAFSLSWFAGYIAFFAPGGLGVREVLLAVLLGTLFASGEVAVYATIHRLAWVIAEVLLGAFSALVLRLPASAEDSVAARDQETTKHD